MMNSRDQMEVRQAVASWHPIWFQLTLTASDLNKRVAIILEDLEANMPEVIADADPKGLDWLVRNCLRG